MAANEKKGFTQKWMRHSTGVSDLGALKKDHLQSVNDFVTNIFHLFTYHTGRSNSLLSHREEERKQQGLKMGKRDSLKSG